MYFAGQADGTFAAGTELRFDNGEMFLHKPIETLQGKARLVNVPVEMRGEPPTEDAASGIWVTDWDGDGDLDVISGWFYGGLFVSRNNGTPGEPKLSSEFELIQAGGKPLTEVFQAEPCIADWDGDGRDDLIYGTRNGIKMSAGGVYWCRNTADSGDPVYQAPRLLMESGTERQNIAPSLGRERSFGSSLTVAAIDWEGDGDLDLLIGDTAGMINLKDDLTQQQWDEYMLLKGEHESLMSRYYELTADQETRKSMKGEVDASFAELRKYYKPRKQGERPRTGRVWLIERD